MPAPIRQTANTGGGHPANALVLRNRNARAGTRSIQAGFLERLHAGACSGMTRDGEYPAVHASQRSAAPTEFRQRQSPSVSSSTLPLPSSHLTSMQPTPAACMTLHEGILYGPIQSRRFGVSLGINLLPPGRKVCSFNCVYCQYSWTEPLRSFEGLAGRLQWPSSAASRTPLRDMRVSGRPLDRITIAGHGEPTLHPAFAEVVVGASAGARPRGARRSARPSSRTRRRRNVAVDPRGADAPRRTQHEARRRPATGTATGERERRLL